MSVPENPETGATVPSDLARESSSEATIRPEANEQSQAAEEEGTEEARTREPSSHFTAHQLFYIFGLDGIGALILSGGVNFAIAYGKHHPAALTKSTHFTLS